MTKDQNQTQQEVHQTQTHNDKHSKLFFSSFQNQFQTIKAFVEDLKQLQIQITAKEDSDIVKYTKAIFNYLQHPEALKNQKLYRNSLISLGNFLSIKYSFLEREYLSEKFFKNLVDYFSILCEKQQKEDFNMLAYPVFYIVVLIIYNSDKETSNSLYSKLFVRKFLRALCSVDFQQGNRIQRYLPVIMAFIAKGGNGQENGMLLKQLVLNNIHFCEMEKNHFHFIYSLRVLINKQGFTLGEVRRYNLLEHLTILLTKNIHLQQQVSMILEVLKHILKRHQILGYKMVSPNFIQLLEKCYKMCPEQSLGLLQIVSPCMPYWQKLNMLGTHCQVHGNYEQKGSMSVELKQLQSLKIISIIIQEINLTDLLEFLSVFSIESLLRRTFCGQKRLSVPEQQEIINLIVKIVRSLQVGNQYIKRSVVSMVNQYKGMSRKLQMMMERYFSEADCSFCLE